MSRFHIVNIVDEREFTAPEESRASGADQAVQLLSGSVRRLIAPLSSAVIGSTQLIRRLFSSVDRATPEDPHEDAAPAPDDPGLEDFNIEDFDFTGWYCPYCGHGKTEPIHPRYIQCGKCHEYVCGARVERKPGGQTSFRCHDRCGGGGQLKDGTLTSLTGLGVDSLRPSRLEAGQRKLPGPRPALPSGKKDS